MKEIKFIQITASHSSLFGLDKEGNVYYYTHLLNENENKWIPLNMVAPEKENKKDLP